MTPQATTRDGTRCPLVFADRDVREEAAKVLCSDVVIEVAVAHAITRGQVSRLARPGEPSLKRGQRIARPFNAPWVAVVRRCRGRLVRDRQSNCWQIVRVVELR